MSADTREWVLVIMGCIGTQLGYVEFHAREGLMGTLHVRIWDEKKGCPRYKGTRRISRAQVAHRFGMSTEPPPSADVRKAKREYLDQRNAQWEAAKRD